MFFKKQKYIKNMVVMLVLMFALGFSINVHAEEPVDNNDYSNEVVPGFEKMARWSYTDSTYAALTLDTSGKATGNCEVNGYQNVTTKIIVYTYLQRVDGNEWVNVSSASHTANSWHAAYQDSFGTQSWGHDYRTRNSIYVYSGNSYENIVFYSNVHHYHSVGDTSNCIN
ncbi:hypothetical protein [Frisingicoccus sp.]|uniref:hypothetical protein n=1 Tax=Frisingicoccus sp. TaxID=1918627 RepID=UPI003AB25099